MSQDQHDHRDRHCPVCNGRCPTCGAAQECIGVLGGGKRLTQCPIWRTHEAESR